MKTFVAGVALVLAVGVVGAQDEATKKDLKAMEGTWAVTALEIGGMKIPEDDNKKVNAKLVVKDGKYTVYFDEKPYTTGTIKLDAGKSPKHIDAIAADGPTKDKVMPGIYQIAGDTMKVCFGEPSKERPTAFSTKEKTAQMLLSYKRVKN